MKGPACHTADDAWATATSTDVDLLDRPSIDSVLAAIRTARSRLDAVEVRAARRLRHLAEQGRSESAEHAISCGTGQSGRDARDVTDREELCEQQPQLEDALESGDLTVSHLDAIHRAARNLPDDVRHEYLMHTDQLLLRAQQLSPDAFARECRRLAKHLVAMSRRGASDAEELEAQRAASKVTRWIDKITGMHHTAIELDPVRDAKLDAAIHRALATRRATSKRTGATVPWQQQMVDATLDAITGDAGDDASPDGGAAAGDMGGPPGATGALDPEAGHRPGRSAIVDRVPDISIVADLATLLGLAEASGLCETVDGVPLPVSTVRRLCCDAEIVPTVLDGVGDVIDHGRSRRTASRPQRRALRAMYASCAHPGCSIGFSACRVHHVRHWLEHRGPTDLDNLLPLCEHHHHLVHEGGWTLTMNGNRLTTWIRPDGVVSATDPGPNRQPTADSPP